MSHYWEDILNSSSAVNRMRGVLRSEIKERWPNDEGVKKQYSNVIVRFLYPPLPCPVALRSVTKQHGIKAALHSTSPVV